jgi:hypothetical protein
MALRAEGAAALPALPLESMDLAEAMPDVYGVGLSEGLLDLAEAYLGEPCLYLGAVLKKEAPDAPGDGTRQWHLDIEDMRMFRALIYLNDVEAGGGPLEFVPASASRAACDKLGYRSGYLTDQRLAPALPPSAARVALGRAGDAQLFDGSRILHRAQPPRIADRYSLTLCYATRRPLEIRRTARLHKPTFNRLHLTLSARQAACLPAPLTWWALLGF